MEWLYILVGQVVVWGSINLIVLVSMFYAWHFFIAPFQRVYATLKFTTENRGSLKDEYKDLNTFELLKIHSRNGLFKIQMDTCDTGYCEDLNYAIVVNWFGVMRYRVDRVEQP